MKLAIFASGNGSNFQAIAEAVAAGEIEAEITLLFCDKKDAYVVQRARAMSIPVISFAPKDFESKAMYEAEILHLLEEEQIDLVVLAGYMRIIGPTLLEVFSNRMINIHPSLLPEFPGLHGIRDAFLAEVPETGVTIHYVDDGVDTGPIIAQEKVRITSFDTLDSLEKKIHTIEHKLFPSVLAQLIKTQQGESH
ncbi:phosphoribosylglycinamide formyltransferase [Enterococcus sp. 7E2_DIV0204]|uniref:Phosphoribosylglycinamide formyltransferase n=1 Tax=Candidatus Enterococcus lemimoniae TaxID=1834167 RepID=A0ABZ2T2X9_9ENTE|nr:MULTISPECIES: phosphoribosylglycinamide formyltransferase [unclassified Enterococcus]OTN90184.1 phosphoribosylglycinamide formyltransferase [Enterococcus sp. 7E2_DIV0204]OTO69041.1 phosphoribosylglycinamide formyltransferase [Enterococcus sp. 12C11_DIV0727]OTP52640.1 phosphoribosylglycinamide formyltransferase [Enterococcus sp. 7D2_DIV0200]